MTQPVDIERIVREVVRRLRQHAAPDAARPATASPNAPAGDALIVAERVVTLRQLEGRLEGASEVVVPVAAVVTPSAFDELRRHGARLRRCSATQPALPPATAATTDASGASPSAAATAHHASNAARLWLVSDGELHAGMRSAVSAVPEERRLGGSLPQALAALASRLGDPQQRGLVVSDRGMLAAAAANRHADLRAAWVRSPDDLRLAGEQLAANVLVVGSKLPPLARRALDTLRRAPLEGAPRTLTHPSSVEERP